MAFRQNRVHHSFAIGAAGLTADPGHEKHIGFATGRRVSPPTLRNNEKKDK